MQKVIIPIPIGVAGANTRTDEKALPAPGLIEASNVTFAVPGRLQKRNGQPRIGGSSFAAEAVAAVGGSLVALRRGASFWYEESSGTFAGSTRAGESLGIGHQLYTGQNRLYQRMDSARTATHEWLVCDTVPPGKIVVFSRELSTGRVRVSETTTATCTRPKIVTWRGAIYLFYVSGANILLAAANANGTISGSEITLVSNLNASAQYDICLAQTSLGGFSLVMVYATTTGVGEIQLGVLNSHGTPASFVPTAAPFAPAATATSLTVIGDSTSLAAPNSVCIAWAENATPRVRARIFNGGTFTNPVIAITNIASPTPANVAHVGGLFNGSEYAIYYETEDVASTADHITWRGTITSGAAVSNAEFARHSTMLSKPWFSFRAAQGQEYVVLGFVDDIQRGAFVWVREDGGGTISPCAALMSGEATGFNPASYLCSSWVPNADPAFPLPDDSTGQDDMDPMVAIQGLPSPLAENNFGRAIKIGFSHLDRYANTVVNSQLYVSGGQLNVDSPFIPSGSSDGRGGCEACLALFPEGITLTPGVGAGSMTPGGTYSYHLFWETFDGNGDIIRSSYAGAQLVTLGGGDNEVVITVRSLAHTKNLYANKPTWLGVYRTREGETLVHRRVSLYPSSITGDNGYCVNNPTINALTFTDGMSDADLLERETDYQSSVPVEMDNIAPPAHTVIASGNDRVFLSGFAHDPNIVWFSKTRVQGRGLEFNDALTFSIDAGDGPITALTCLQDGVIAFRRTAIYVVGGNGPDNTNNGGVGGGWELSRIISEEIGCIDGRSPVRLPVGIMFKSRKGYYILGNNLALQYIGAPMEDYNSEPVTSAVAMTHNHEVRITTPSRTMVYDYLANLWATWTIGALHSCVVGSNWVTLAADGTWIGRSGSGFIDFVSTAYSQSIRTGWIRLSGIQSYQRLYRILFMATWRAGTHKPRVRLFFDYEISAGYDVDLEGVTSTEPYQFCVRPPRQKIQAVQILIEDIASGGTLGDSFALSEIALEVGVLPPQTRRLASGKTAV